jgi:hypothetical protein
MNHRRIVASLVAPLVALAPLLLLDLYEAQKTPIIIDGQSDDAPTRAFGLFVVALPANYVVLASLAAVLGTSLVALGAKPSKFSIMYFPPRSSQRDA